MISYRLQYDVIDPWRHRSCDHSTRRWRLLIRPQ